MKPHWGGCEHGAVWAEEQRTMQERTMQEAQKMMLHKCFLADNRIVLRFKVSAQSRIPCTQQVIQKIARRKQDPFQPSLLARSLQQGHVSPDIVQHALSRATLINNGGSAASYSSCRLSGTPFMATTHPEFGGTSAIGNKPLF